MSSQSYRFRATVCVDSTAETESEARRAAFELLTTASAPSKRGRGAPTAPKAMVTGVTLDSLDPTASASVKVDQFPVPSGYIGCDVTE